MVQNTFSQNHPAYILGQAIGPRESRPFGIPALAHIETFVLVDASPVASEAWTLAATDVETGQVHTLPFESGASLAATLDAAVAAVAGDGKFNDLFTATEDGATDLVLTAKHVGRDYTFVMTPLASGSATVTNSTTQESGGQKLAFGRMLARVAGNGGLHGDARELSATDTLRSLAGGLFRAETNHVHQYEPDAIRAGYDGFERGVRHASLMRRGVMVVEPENAPAALTDPVFVRRALTGSVGTLGGFSNVAEGGQQLFTITPTTTNLAGYGFQFDYDGFHHSALYLTDNTVSIAVAIDGMIQDLGAVDGLTITDNGTTLTIETAAGTAIENMHNTLTHEDVPVDSVTIVETNPSDIDSIDISSIAEWGSLVTSQGYALLRFTGGF